MAQEQTGRDAVSPDIARDGEAGPTRGAVDLGIAGRDLSGILKASPVGISVSRVRDGLIVEMNEEFLRILGFTHEEVVGRTSHELNLWTEPDQRETIVREFLKHGFFSPRPTVMRRKDGSHVTVLFSASALAARDEPHTIAWVMDLSERLRAEQQLRQAEEKWRTLLENAPVVILTVDRAGTIQTFNRSLYGRPAAALIGKNIHDFITSEDDRRTSIALLERVFREGVSQSFEVDSFDAAGERVRMRNILAPMRSGGEVSAAIGIGMDITAEARAADALKESEQRFRDIVQSLGDWVWEVDSEARLTYSSPQVENLLGYTAAEMLGRTPMDSVVPEDRDAYRSGHETLFRHPEPFRDREVWHRHKNGHRVCISVSAVPVFDAGGAHRGFRGVAHDVTERRREEAEVQQARRVESLGVLAGGIAHDFNNLLTAILGNAELALDELPPDGSTRPLLAQIQSAGQHAAELTRQMLAYAGRGSVTLRAVDLTSSVREMAQLLNASIPKKVALALDLVEGLPPVEADPAQLRQVVMNLVINAVDAIGDREGRIAVRTLTSGFQDRFRSDLTLGKIEAGREQVCVEIEDSGSGIAPADLAKIFDPFFTTKFTGRGLGLAAVQGIVLRHGGTIAVSTAPGAGSTFRVCYPALPRRPGAAAPVADGPPAAAAAGAPWRGSGTILLVDDEAPVRSMATRMLQVLGFQVLTAADGREALEVAAAAPGLRAVLLDLTMPHMDGRETFHELRRLRAGLPVVLCSGYDILESTDRFAGLAFSGFLQKPYRLEDMSRALRRALGE